MMLKLKNKIAGLIWASSRETKCPEGDSILSLKNKQPDTITGVFLAHRLIINNVDWVHAEPGTRTWKNNKLNNTEQLQGRGHWWLQPCVGTRNSISCQLSDFYAATIWHRAGKGEKDRLCLSPGCEKPEEGKKKIMKNLEHLSVICTEPLQAARCRYFIYRSVCLVYLHNSAASVKLFRNIHRKMRAFNWIPFKLPLGLIIQKRLSQNFW